nr:MULTISPECIES: hypothetical protein [Streptomyces]
MNRCSGLCLAVDEGSTADGASIEPEPRLGDLRFP